MFIKYIGVNPVSPTHTLGLICPQCGRHGTFHFTNLNDLSFQSDYLIGLRYCPYNECKCLVYFIYRPNSETLEVVFPSLRIDFDATNIPVKIVSSFEEAITCHANNCFIASAIMIRKTLEVLCDEKGASGKNLKDRIKDLGSKVILPKELFDGLDDLRLLGNDAAHIEAKSFDDVGKEELEVGIEFTKEILKAIYQYSKLLDKLKKLKKPKV